jgi:hypothetical protein
MGFFYPQWQKITRIGVTTPPTTTGYQVKVEIPWQPGMRDDFADLRFSDYYRTLPYWIETSTTRSTATVWVKLTEINTASNEFFCYYGNGGASSESNGDTTFDFFDDFPGSSLDTSKWDTSLGTYTVSNSILNITGTVAASFIYSKTLSGANYASKQRMMKTIAADPNGAYLTGFRDPIGTSNNFAVFYSQWPTGAKNNGVNGNNTGTYPNVVFNFPTANVYHNYEIKRNGATSILYSVDGAGEQSTTTYIPSKAIPSACGCDGSAGGCTTYWDWVLVRKYQSTEPTCTPAESGINTAWYIGVLRAKHVLVSITLTAVQHLTHIDLTWSE